MLRSAVLHFYDTFEFVSPFAMHGGGSDLNTSSQSGDKERESPAWVLPEAT